MEKNFNLIIKLDRNNNKIIKYFSDKSLKCISLCGLGYNITLEYLKITINDNDIKLFNTINGISIGGVKYNIPDEYYNEDLIKLQIEYKYINIDNLPEDKKIEFNKFKLTYNSDCFIICECEGNLSNIINNNNKYIKYELKNSLNKNI